MKRFKRFVRAVAFDVLTWVAFLVCFAIALGVICVPLWWFLNTKEEYAQIAVGAILVLVSIGACIFFLCQIITWLVTRWREAKYR